MSIRYRSIFISDVHLGTPDCRADYLLDFLRATQCDRLYLVGDIIDLQALARRSYWPASHAAVVAQVLAMAANGTQVTYVPGNHDAALRGLHGETVGGVRICLRAEHVGADGRRYRVTHGDEFDASNTGRQWLNWIGEYGHRGLRLFNRNLNGLRRHLQLPYLPLAIITKSRLATAMAYICGFEQRVAADCAQAGFDGHICGHIHYGNIRRIGTALYLNDGDWVEHCTALVENDAGEMSLLHWSEHRTELAQASRDQAVVASIARPPFASFSPSAIATARAAERLVA